MAIHPKVGVLGGALIGAVVAGLLLFLFGRMTAGADLAPVLGGAVAGIVVVGAVGYGVWRSLPSSKRFEGLLHVGSQPSAEGYVSAQARFDLVGKSGTAISELRPAGVADIEGERMDVTTEGGFVAAGTPVAVVHAEGMRLVVRPIPRVTAGSNPPSGS